MLIVELVMLLAGLLIAITGNVPSWVMGGPRYEVRGRGVRWLGVVLALPLPITLVASIVAAFTLPESEAAGIAGVIELFAVLICAIVALVMMVRLRKPRTTVTADGVVMEAPPDIEAEIARKVRGSLFYALLGILGFTAIILCPLAFFRAGQALRTIDQQGVGTQYRGQAKAARTIAIVVFMLWAGVAVLIVAPLLVL